MDHKCMDFFTPYQDFFAPLYGRRIFLTGGTGFFGKWLLTAFAAANRTTPDIIRVTVLSRRPELFLLSNPDFRLPWLEFATGDIRDFAFPAGNYDYVIHAATESTTTLEKDDPEAMYKVITDGTRRMLEFARLAGVKKILYVSSGGVYGPQPPALPLLPEDYPCQPTTIYGQGKLAAEELCRQSGIPSSIARCFAFVGPYLPLDIHFAVGNFIRDVLADRPIVIQGDGTPYRSYLYTGDLVLWLLRILTAGSTGQSYNVGSDQPVSIRELAELTARAGGVEPQVIVKQTPPPDALPSRYVPDISRAVRELNLDVYTPLESALAQTIAWHRAKA